MSSETLNTTGKFEKTNHINNIEIKIVWISNPLYPNKSMDHYEIFLAKSNPIVLDNEDSPSDEFNKVCDIVRNPDIGPDNTSEIHDRYYAAKGLF